MRLKEVSESNALEMEYCFISFPFWSPSLWTVRFERLDWIRHFYRAQACFSWSREALKSPPSVSIRRCFGWLFGRFPPISMTGTMLAIDLSVQIKWPHHRSRLFSNFPVLDVILYRSWLPSLWCNHCLLHHWSNEIASSTLPRSGVHRFSSRPTSEP